MLRRLFLAASIAVAAFLIFIGFAFVASQVQAAEPTDPTLTFNRDIRPILSDKCFACHGPDAETREADLRLDQAESATKDRGGYAAIAPGNVDNSEVLNRIKTDDESIQMPPPDFGKPLSVEERQTLEQWIREGANFQTHWSFVAPTRPLVPEVDDLVSSDSAIDAFVAARLEQERLQPVEQADPRTLVRRLSFDLTGLPPDPKWVSDFEANPTEEQYQQLVDQLLSSPHYGERMAIYWLDLVRYADTLGYHGDQERSVSPYRDYVIDAFNNNLPFDQFTIEQLAGDLLPEPTLSQLVASTYNRLNRASGEGGVQPKEYLAKYSADRVRTTGAVWLGTTFGCAECHDHKFDPFTAKDFYSFAAFFADIKEQGIVSGAQHIERLPVPSEAQQVELAAIEQAIAQANNEYQADTEQIRSAFAEWQQQLSSEADRWKTLIPESAESSEKTKLAIQSDHSILASGNNPQTDDYLINAKTNASSVAALRLEVLTDDSLPTKGPGRAGNGNFVLQGLELTINGQPIEWEKAFATHSQNQHSPSYVIDGKKNGWAILPQAGKPHQLILIAKQPVSIDSESAEVRVRIVQQFGTGHNIGKLRLSISEANDDGSSITFASPEIAAIISKPESERSLDDTDTLSKAFREQTPLLADSRKKLQELNARKSSLEKAIPTTLVSKSTTPREIRILPRGDWMNSSGAVVLPAVPDFMSPGVLSDRLATGERLSRLDLAHWLVDPNNPLVARTFVNRLWMLFFGSGLSKSVDDLGSQGELPSHPELLDWLAIEFIESGWDVQHIIRLIVESETYKRASRPTDELRNRDPYNRLLARQSRFRLDAEMVRDNALAVSGLLVRELGGPSVRPYQPAGYWAQLNFPKREYQNDTGKRQYRRGLYTHWQRTFLHPSMLAFDAPAREECTAKRERSNTPLQALVLLNDPTYVEAAKVLAERAVREAEGSFEQRLDWLFRTALNRQPRDLENRVLGDLFESNLSEYGTAQLQAAELLTVGQSKTADEIDKAQLAAWTAVTRAILNLHETIMRY